jgi:hypothetical protein
MAVRAFLEPGCSLGGACKVVQPQMHVARYGDTAFNLVEETQELLLAVVSRGSSSRSLNITNDRPAAGRVDQRERAGRLACGACGEG